MNTLIKFRLALIPYLALLSALALLHPSRPFADDKTDGNETDNFSKIWTAASQTSVEKTHAAAVERSNAALKTGPEEMSPVDFASLHSQASASLLESNEQNDDLFHRAIVRSGRESWRQNPNVEYSGSALTGITKLNKQVDEAKIRKDIHDSIASIANAAAKKGTKLSPLSKDAINEDVLSVTDRPENRIKHLENASIAHQKAAIEAYGKHNFGLGEAHSEAVAHRTHSILRHHFRQFEQSN